MNPCPARRTHAAFRPRRALRLLPLLALAWAAAGCEVYDQFMTPMFLMSPAEEVEFGQKVREQIDADLTFVNDPKVVGYVREIGNIVAANAAEQAKFPVQFHVVEDESINAFAIPGGSIYVHTGLIHAAEDEAELASVLAHEYGHVVFRHSARSVSRATGLSLFQQVLLGEETQQQTEIIADLIARGVMTNYSRQDEYEADSIAVPTLYRANYDPAAMVDFFQTLRATYGDQRGVLTLFATHPPTSDRISRVQQLIVGLPPKGRLHRPVTQLRSVQGRLQELGITGP